MTDAGMDNYVPVNCSKMCSVTVHNVNFERWVTMRKVKWPKKKFNSTWVCHRKSYARLEWRIPTILSSLEKLPKKYISHKGMTLHNLTSFDGTCVSVVLVPQTIHFEMQPAHPTGWQPDCLKHPYLHRTPWSRGSRWCHPFWNWATSGDWCWPRGLELWYQTGYKKRHNRFLYA